jgi:hypothetical protein
VAQTLLPVLGLATKGDRKPTNVIQVHIAAERVMYVAHRREPWVAGYKLIFQPRSGEISNAGLSRRSRYRRSAAGNAVITIPTAHAVGYVDIAAPRLVAAGVSPVQHGSRVFRELAVDSL